MQDRELMELLDNMKLRIGGEPVRLEAPPADLWDGIQLQLDDEPVAAQSTPPVSGADLLQEQSNVTSLDHHRSRRRPAGILLGAVAASIVAAIAFVTVRGSNDPTVVDQVALETLANGESAGDARILNDDGTLWLDVDLTDELAADGTQFYELWIIDSEVQEMHSLGRIAADGKWMIPEGVDVDQFPIVDISVEEDDGDDTHSGNSVLRGIRNV